MKCENCGKNEVTFVYQSNVNGRITEKRLCADCAEKLGYTQKLASQTQRMMRGLFGGGLFEDFFTPYPSLLGPPAEAKPEPPKAQDSLLEQGEQNEISRTRQLNALRLEMRQAVDQENFERAAELRDQIRTLENSGG